MIKINNQHNKARKGISLENSARETDMIISTDQLSDKLKEIDKN